MLIHNTTLSGFWLPKCDGHAARLLPPGSTDVSEAHFRLAEKHGMVALYLRCGRLEAEALAPARQPHADSGLDAMNVREAKHWIDACEDDELLLGWRLTEEESKARKTVLDMIDHRLTVLDADSFEGAE